MRKPRRESAWSQLTPAVFRHIAQSLHPNEVVLSLKLVSKEVAECLRDDYKTYQLRQKQDGAAPAFCPALDGVVVPRYLAAQPWPGAEFVAHWGRPEPWRVLTRRQRHTLLCLAASSGHAASLAAALEHCGTAVQADALASAAARGDVAAFRNLLHEGNASWTPGVVWQPAAANGHVEHMRLMAAANMLSDGFDDVEPRALADVELAACFAGQAGVLQWLDEKWGDEDARWQRAKPHAAAAAAGEGGQVSLLQGLLAARPPAGAAERSQVLYGVAYGCPLPVLQKYYEQWDGLGGAAGVEQGGGAQGAADAAVADVAVAAGRRQELLMRAATSPMPDWAAKVDWLLSRWHSSPGWPVASSHSYYRGWQGSALWHHAARAPGYLQRLQHLTAAHGLELPAEAVAAAGAAGDVDAASFCLGLPPVLYRGPRAAGCEAERREPAELLALAAASAGQVAVLRLLKERGTELGGAHVEAVMDSGEGLCGPYRDDREPEFAGLPALRYLVMEGGLDAGAAGAVNWSDVFRHAARYGADTPLLRHLVEQRGAELDLEAVAHAGSEEQLSWALARKKSKAGAMELFETALLGGNWAAADHMKRRNLDPHTQQQLQGLFCRLAAESGTPQHFPALAWLLDNYELVWTPGCLNALEELSHIAFDGGWYIPHGQACNWRRMVRDALAALGKWSPETAGMGKGDERKEGASDAT